MRRSISKRPRTRQVIFQNLGAMWPAFTRLSSSRKSVQKRAWVRGCMIVGLWLCSSKQRINIWNNWCNWKRVHTELGCLSSHLFLSFFARYQQCILLQRPIHMATRWTLLLQELVITFYRGPRNPISEHFSIISKILLPKPPLIKKTIQYRKIKNVSISGLKRMIYVSPIFYQIHILTLISLRNALTQLCRSYLKFMLHWLLRPSLQDHVFHGFQM